MDAMAIPVGLPFLESPKRQLLTLKLGCPACVIHINNQLTTLPGGPLTVQEVSYVLAGVVSGGGKVCGKPRVPSIYTRVARYAEWLKVGGMSLASLTSNPSDGDATEMNAVVHLG